jgi:hypothetical protein
MWLSRPRGAAPDRDTADVPGRTAAAGEYVGRLPAVSWNCSKPSVGADFACLSPIQHVTHPLVPPIPERFGARQGSANCRTLGRNGTGQQERVLDAEIEVRQAGAGYAVFQRSERIITNARAWVMSANPGIDDGAGHLAAQGTQAAR